MDTKRKDFSVIDCGTCGGFGKIPNSLNGLDLQCPDCNGIGLTIITHKKEVMRYPIPSTFKAMREHVSAARMGQRNQTEHIEQSLLFLCLQIDKLKEDKLKEQKQNGH